MCHAINRVNTPGGKGMGGANDHPSPLEFQYRLRWFILGKHSAAVFRQNKNKNKNTEENHEPCLLQPLEMPSKFCLTGSVLSNFANNFNVNPCDELDQLQVPLVKMLKLFHIFNEHNYSCSTPATDSEKNNGHHEKINEKVIKPVDNNVLGMSYFFLYLIEYCFKIINNPFNFIIIVGLKINFCRLSKGRSIY
jgi:hypothetical protein